MTSDEKFNIPASLVNKNNSNLSNNKPCGLDGIFYEHIQYGGFYLFFCPHASSRLLLTTTVSLVNDVKMLLFVYLRVIINFG